MFLVEMGKSRAIPGTINGLVDVLLLSMFLARHVPSFFNGPSLTSHQGWLQEAR